MVNATLYLTGAGCQWRNLPREFPPYATVFDYFSHWQKDGTLDRLHAALRRRVRVQQDRQP